MLPGRWMPKSGGASEKRGFGHDPSAGYNVAPLLVGVLQAAAHWFNCLTDAWRAARGPGGGHDHAQEAPARG